jgi:hypothetical protein
MTSLCHYAIRYSQRSKSLTVYGNGIPRISIAADLMVSAEWVNIDATWQLGSNTAIDSALTFSDLRLICLGSGNPAFSLINSLNVEPMYNAGVVNGLGCPTTTTTTTTTTGTSTTKPPEPRPLHYFPLAGDIGDRVAANIGISALNPFITSFDHNLDLITNVNGNLNYLDVAGSAAGSAALINGSLKAVALRLDKYESGHALRAYSLQSFMFNGGRNLSPSPRGTIQFWVKFNCVKGDWHLKNIITFASNPSNDSSRSGTFRLILEGDGYLYFYVGNNGSWLGKVDVDFLVDTWYFFNICMYIDEARPVNLQTTISISAFAMLDRINNILFEKTWQFLYYRQFLGYLNYIHIGGDGSTWAPSYDRDIAGAQTLMVSGLVIWDVLIFAAKAKELFNYGNGINYSWPYFAGGDVQCPVHRFPFDNDALDVSRINLYAPLQCNAYGDINFTPSSMGDAVVYNSAVDPAGYLSIVSLASESIPIWQNCAYCNMIGSGNSYGISIWFKDTDFKTAKLDTTGSDAVLQLSYLNEDGSKVPVTSVSQILPGLDRRPLLNYFKNDFPPSRYTIWDFGSSPKVGVWNHLVISYDGYYNRYVLYLNGQACVDDQRDYRPLTPIGAPKKIGMVLDLGGSTQWSFDELRIYDRQLSSIDALTLYGGGSGNAEICRDPGPTTTSTTTTTTPPYINTPYHYYPFSQDTYDYFYDSDIAAVGGVFETFDGVTGFTPPSTGAQHSATFGGFTFSDEELVFTVFIRPVASSSELAIISLDINNITNLNVETTQTFELRLQAPGTLRVAWNGVESTLINISLPINAWSFLAFKRLKSGFTAISLNNGSWYNGPIINATPP